MFLVEPPQGGEAEFEKASDTRPCRYRSSLRFDRGKNLNAIHLKP